MKKIDSKDQEISSPEEPVYDLSAVGDAPPLAAMENPLKADNPDSPPDKDGEEEKGKRSPDEKETERDKNAGKDASEASENTLPIADSTILRLLRLAVSILSGETAEKDLLPLLDAAKVREEISKARAEGEIAGRNAVIEERLRVDNRQAPNLCGAPASRRQPASIFDIAAEAKR